jgi:hypothetical protein
VAVSKQRLGDGDLDGLLKHGDTWTVS